jgi:hypothetical protein
VTVGGRAADNGLSERFFEAPPVGQVGQRVFEGEASDNFARLGAPHALPTYASDSPRRIDQQTQAQRPTDSEDNIVAPHIV